MTSNGNMLFKSSKGGQLSGRYGKLPYMYLVVFLYKEGYFLHARVVMDRGVEVGGGSKVNK